MLKSLGQCIFVHGRFRSTNHDVRCTRSSCAERDREACTRSHTFARAHRGALRVEIRTAKHLRSRGIRGNTVKHAANQKGLPRFADTTMICRNRSASLCTSMYMKQGTNIVVDLIVLACSSYLEFRTRKARSRSRIMVSGRVDHCAGIT